MVLLWLWRQWIHKNATALAGAEIPRRFAPSEWHVTVDFIVGELVISKELRSNDWEISLTRSVGISCHRRLHYSSTTFCAQKKTSRMCSKWQVRIKHFRRGDKPWCRLSRRKRWDGFVRLTGYLRRQGPPSEARRHAGSEDGGARSTPERRAGVPACGVRRETRRGFGLWIAGSLWLPEVRSETPAGWFTEPKARRKPCLEWSREGLEDSPVHSKNKIGIELQLF